MPKPLTIDTDFVQQVPQDLLPIPSPTGRTEHVMQYVGEQLRAIGIGLCQEHNLAHTLADFPSLAVQPADEEGPREGPIGIGSSPASAA